MDDANLAQLAMPAESDVLVAELFQRQRYLEATYALRRLLLETPESVPLLRMAGLAAVFRRDGEAIKQAILQLDAAGAPAHTTGFLVALLLFIANKHDEAAAELTDLLKAPMVDAYLELAAIEIAVATGNSGLLLAVACGFDSEPTWNRNLELAGKRLLRPLLLTCLHERRRAL